MSRVETITRRSRSVVFHDTCTDFTGDSTSSCQTNIVLESSNENIFRTVLASIHDAIVIRERLSQYELEVIVDHMRSTTHNRYWSLTGRELVLQNLNLWKY